MKGSLKNTENEIFCSFLIVNYNTGVLTRKYIYELFSVLVELNKISENYFEVIVADNNSTDDSIHLLSSISSPFCIDFSCISLDKNYGFGYANNICANKAKGKYIYILNNDAKLLNARNILKLDEILSNNIGVVGTKVIYPSGSPQPSFQSFSTNLTIILKHLRIGRLRSKVEKFRFVKILLDLFFKNYFLSHKHIDNQMEVDWCSGCSLIMKKNLFLKIGGFDTDFFMYSEDEELCFRIKKMGFDTLYYPDIIVEHLVGASSRKFSPFIEYQKIRSHLLLSKKIGLNYKFIFVSLIITSVLLSPFSKRHFNIIRYLFLKG